MSLKANIGNFRPSKFERTQLNWKTVLEQNAVPLGFYFRLTGVREITLKTGDLSQVIEGEAELDDRAMTDAVLTKLESVTGISRNSPTPISFFSVGSMMLNQFVAAGGENWERDGIGKLFYIKYNGKVNHPTKKGAQFHQVFISEVPETSQEEL